MHHKDRLLDRWRPSSAPLRQARAALACRSLRGLVSQRMLAQQTPVATVKRVLPQMMVEGTLFCQGLLCQLY